MIAVFLGPSLPLDEARALLPDATFLPPVKMGDVHALAERRPRTICIVDGVFEHVPAVWHKEILHALSCGVRVIGASSMGALRAAELSAFGMEGVGAVFEAYRSGALEDDDEVALVHAPGEHGYRALSAPLVDLRFALADAVRAGAIADEVAARLLAASKQRFYPERSWARLLDDAAQLGVPLDQRARLAAIAAARPSVKRDDARLALAACRAERPSARPDFAFEQTVFWHRLVTSTARARSGDAGAATSDVLRRARAVLPDLRDVQRQALLDLLVPAEAERLGITVDAAEIAAAAETLRRERGLVTAADTRAYLAREGIDDRAFAHIARLDALLAKLLDFYEPLLRRDDALAFELRRQGRFAALVDDALRAPRAPSSVPEPELIAWHEQRLGPLAGSLDAHARRRGFASRVELLEELAACWLAERESAI